MIELVSVHVPKTGGAAFLAMLERHYPGERLFRDDGDHIGYPNSLFRTDFEGWLLDTETFVQQLPAAATAIHGHFWAGKYMPYFPDAKKVVWLREPARLVISAYYYWQRIPPHRNPLHRLVLEQNLSLLQFAELPDLQNNVSRLFLRDLTLDHFDFVGIQEHFQDDYSSLCRLMQWPVEKVPLLNNTTSIDYVQHSFDQEIIDRIRTLNAADVALYEQALRRREQRVADEAKSERCF